MKLSFLANQIKMSMKIFSINQLNIKFYEYQDFIFFILLLRIKFNLKLHKKLYSIFQIDGLKVLGLRSTQIIAGSMSRRTNRIAKLY